ncbi:hypothetical protein Mal15_46890 [Stieleria maiorica]|uniref:Uncharacterized protein n=1 Tax=Stieleria maiorica TaxID=2795974 RepID=A0A5B9MP35_9BACT|nr:hypothetical protein [Stieleria maiorica]QEG00618.1 hypothetical protein Mal15_46890 [Stieleria maiorica]
MALPQRISKSRGLENIPHDLSVVRAGVSSGIRAGGTLRPAEGRANRRVKPPRDR